MSSTGGLLDRGESLVSVVDIQEKLAAVMDRREQVIGQTCRLLRPARRLGVPVLVTEQYPEGLGRTVPDVAEAAGDVTPIEKLSFGCCGDSRYMEQLKASGRRQIVLCGMESHVCILQTSLILLDQGLTVQVAVDAICSRRSADHDTALRAMQQVGVRLTTVESVVFQWLGRAGTPEFKDVLKLVK